MRALIISADAFEDSELLVPLYRLREERIEVDVAAAQDGVIRGEHGYAVRAELAFVEVVPARYDLLVLPGGRAADAVRRSDGALAIVEAFFKQDKLVAAICHGAAILVRAGVLEGRRLTAHASVAAEIRHAGAIFEDQAVVVDRNLVSSRRPDDLPAFMRETMRLLRGRASGAEALASAAV